MTRERCFFDAKINDFHRSDPASAPSLKFCEKPVGNYGNFNSLSCKLLNVSCNTRRFQYRVVAKRPYGSEQEGLFNIHCVSDKENKALNQLQNCIFHKGTEKGYPK